MQYFAIGESDGGAGERRLGPFDTKEAAQSAGEKETKESNGGFVFRGVVDEANTQVFTAEGVTALNAKAARNAKFKVGDVVIARGIKGKIVRTTDRGTYIQEGEDGNHYELKEESMMKVSNSVCTTCPVVANAILANRRVARKALNWGPWRPGQRVRKKDGSRNGTVVKQYGLNDLRVIVKWDNGTTEEMHRFQLEEALNAKRMARNADNPVSQMIAKLDAASKELESMVSKATPWREQMKKMRKRYEEIYNIWYKIPSGDPLEEKAIAAMKRYDVAKSRASDLWSSISA